MNQELLRSHGCQSIEVSKLSFGSDPLPDGDIDLVIGSDVTCVACTFPSYPTISSPRSPSALLPLRGLIYRLPAAVRTDSVHDNRDGLCKTVSECLHRGARCVFSHEQ